MISVDTSKDLGANAGTSLTVSYTNGGDILFVGALSTATGDVITGITFNGVAMTKLTSVQEPSSAYLTLFYLINPLKGTANIVVTANTTGTIVGDAVSYTAPAIVGIDQSGTTTGTSVTSLSKSLTTTKDNAWTLAWCGTDGFTISAGAGTTLRQGNGNNRAFLDSNGAIHPAGSKTLNGSFAGSGNAALIMCDFYEVQASAGISSSEI